MPALEDDARACTGQSQECWQVAMTQEVHLPCSSLHECRLLGKAHACVLGVPGVATRLPVHMHGYPRSCMLCLRLRVAVGRPGGRVAPSCAVRPAFTR